MPGRDEGAVPGCFAALTMLALGRVRDDVAEGRHEHIQRVLGIRQGDLEQDGGEQRLVRLADVRRVELHRALVVEREVRAVVRLGVVSSGEFARASLTGRDDELRDLLLADLDDIVDAVVQDEEIRPEPVVPVELLADGQVVADELCHVDEDGPYHAPRGGDEEEIVYAVGLSESPRPKQA